MEPALWQRLKKLGDHAHRDHFKAHLQGGTDHLYISPPVSGSVAGTWQIPLSRRVNKPDGTFGGIA